MEINGVAHLILRVNRMADCTAFYDQLMPFLGAEPVIHGDEFVYYVGGRTALGIRPADPKHADALHIETAAGIEVGIVADPGDFHIREPARSVYRRLIDSGVWLTAETEVASLFRTPDDGRGPRGEALAEFARQYSLRSPAYLLHWARFLRGLHREGSLNAGDR